MLFRSFPVRELRPCVTHCNFMSLEAIARMEKLGIVADLQPDWLWLDGQTLRKQFGEERLSYFQPYNPCSITTSSSAAARTTCRRSAACAR